MRPAARRCTFAAALLAVAGCGGAPELPPMQPPQPSAGQPAEPIEITPVAAPPEAAPGATRSRLANGMSTLVFAFDDGPADSAEIAFHVAAGADHGRPGLARLAADLLLDCGDATAGRVELRRAIEALGGHVESEVGPADTWFTLRVPAPRWQEALRELAAALRAEPAGRTRLEQVHTELLRDSVAAVFRSPERTQAASLLLGHAGSGEWLEALQARDPSEAVLYQARWYRPERAALALRVPATALAVASAVADAFGAWRPASIAADPQSDPSGRAMPTGIFWSPSPGPSRAIVVCRMPPLTDAKAPALHALWNCVTLGGVGGRLERLQREHGLGDVSWESIPLRFGEIETVLLATTTTPEHALQLFQLVRTAVRSMADVAITPSEQEIATRRTQLTFRRSAADDVGRLQLRAALRLHGLPDDQLVQRLDALGPPGALAGAVPDLLALPLAMVVLGGTPPADAPEVREMVLLPPSLMAFVAGGGDADLQREAKPWLDRAFEAVGGRERLVALTGLRLTATTTTQNGPPLEEALEWTVAGRLRLTRTLLGQLIETSIDGSEWTETVAGQHAELEPLEASWRRAEVERLPTALLAAAARGDLPFRLMARREVKGREHVVLEAVGGRFERLRMQLDAGSGLVRVVEHWTTSPDGVPTYIVETWSDYRSSQGLRVPFLRETDVDDGRSRRITTFATATPLFDR